LIGVLLGILFLVTRKKRPSRVIKITRIKP
jgi:hypothetical protein